MGGPNLAVDGGEKTVERPSKPGDIDWPAISGHNAAGIGDQLGRILSGLNAPSQASHGTDGPQPAGYYQIFYPRSMALYRYLLAVALTDNKAKRLAIPYFWEEVARILKSWGRQHPSSFDILAQLEVRLMDLTELIRAGRSHEPLPEEEDGLIGLADFIGDTVSA